MWPVLLHRGRGKANRFVRLHDLDDLLRREERERADRDEDDADEHEQGDHAAGRHHGFPRRELLLVELGVHRPLRLDGYFVFDAGCIHCPMSRRRSLRRCACLIFTRHDKFK